MKYFIRFLNNFLSENLSSNSEDFEKIKDIYKALENAKFNTSRFENKKILELFLYNLNENQRLNDPKLRALKENLINLYNLNYTVLDDIFESLMKKQNLILSKSPGIYNLIHMLYSRYKNQSSNNLLIFEQLVKFLNSHNYLPEIKDEISKLNQLYEKNKEKFDIVNLIDGLEKSSKKMFYESFIEQLEELLYNPEKKLSINELFKFKSDPAVQSVIKYFDKKYHLSLLNENLFFKPTPIYSFLLIEDGNQYFYNLYNFYKKTEDDKLHLLKQNEVLMLNENFKKLCYILQNGEINDNSVKFKLGSKDVIKLQLNADKSKSAYFNESEITNPNLLEKLMPLMRLNFSPVLNEQLKNIQLIWENLDNIVKIDFGINLLPKNQQKMVYSSLYKLNEDYYLYLYQPTSLSSKTIFKYVNSASKFKDLVYEYLNYDLSDNLNEFLKKDLESYNRLEEQEKNVSNDLKLLNENLQKLLIIRSQINENEVSENDERELDELIKLLELEIQKNTELKEKISKLKAEIYNGNEDSLKENEDEDEEACEEDEVKDENDDKDIEEDEEKEEESTMVNSPIKFQKDDQILQGRLIGINSATKDYLVLVGTKTYRVKETDILNMNENKSLLYAYQVKFRPIVILNIDSETAKFKYLTENDLIFEADNLLMKFFSRKNNQKINVGDKVYLKNPLTNLPLKDNVYQVIGFMSSEICYLIDKYGKVKKVKINNISPLYESFISEQEEKKFNVKAIVKVKSLNQTGIIQSINTNTETIGVLLDDGSTVEVPYDDIVVIEDDLKRKNEVKKNDTKIGEKILKQSKFKDLDKAVEDFNNNPTPENWKALELALKKHKSAFEKEYIEVSKELEANEE